MIDYVLEDAKSRLLQGQEALARHDAESVIGYYHGALESLVRWSLVRDGAEPDIAFDPDTVTWPDLLAYLDVRAVAPDFRQVIAAAHATHAAVLAGQIVAITPRQAVQFARVVEQMFHRFWPQSEAERQQATLRAELSKYDVDTPQAGIAADAFPALPESAADYSAPVDPESAETPRLQPSLPAESLFATDAPAPTAPNTPAPNDATDAVPVAQSADDLTEQERWDRLEAMAYGAQATYPPELGAHVGISDEEDRQRRVIEAGRRLGELQASGFTYCPKCRSTISMVAAQCPYCEFDIAAFKSRAANAARTQPGLLDRLFGKR